jgi:hypothetical protein
MTEPGNARERDVCVQLSSALRVNAGTETAAGVLQETGTRRQQIEQQSHARPFAGPKPESMMVPRGERRSDEQAHPSRLG